MWLLESGTVNDSFKLKQVSLLLDIYNDPAMYCNGMCQGLLTLLQKVYIYNVHKWFNGWMLGFVPKILGI